MIEAYASALADRCRHCPAAQRTGSPDWPALTHREFDRTGTGLEVVVTLMVTRGATFLRSGWGDGLTYRHDRSGD